MPSLLAPGADRHAASSTAAHRSTRPTSSSSPIKPPPPPAARSRPPSRSRARPQSTHRPSARHRPHAGARVRTARPTGPAIDHPRPDHRHRRSIPQPLAAPPIRRRRSSAGGALRHPRRRRPPALSRVASASSSEEASLRLALTIDARGRVTAVEPVGAADPTFLAAARRHILRALALPAGDARTARRSPRPPSSP